MKMKLSTARTGVITEQITSTAHDALAINLCAMAAKTNADNDMSADIAAGVGASDFA